MKRTVETEKAMTHYRGAVAGTAPLVMSTLIPAAALADVFAFHLDTRNAALISPRGTRVVRVVGSFPVATGDRVELHVRQFPLPVTQRWLVEIEAVVEPTLVVDRMLGGPFRTWRHEHRFREVAGGVELTDAIAYTLPLGAVGRLADRLVVRPMLRRAFVERHRRTREALAATSDPGARPRPSGGAEPA